MNLSDPSFWAALLEIIGVNIILSGDNAVVIALAARALPPHQQRQAVIFGSGAAIAMRIGLTIFAVELLKFPWLKLIGAVLLVWIGMQLLGGDGDGDEEGHLKTTDSMLGAIKTILIADLVMSLDNVIAVAAAAKGSNVLLILGLAISIPLVIFGSTLLLKLMGRFPVIITLGAALLGFVAGEMAWTDPAISGLVSVLPKWGEYVLAALGAVFVVSVGRWWARRQQASAAQQEQRA